MENHHGESKVFTKRKSIKLFVENFGPIEKADIEIGDFTVIIGPNSSGKTFLTLLADRMIAAASESFSFSVPNSVFNAIDEIIVKGEDKGYPININMSEYPKETVDQIVDYVMNNLNKIGVWQNLDFGTSFAQKIFQYFQTDPNNLIRFGSDHARIMAYFEHMEIDITIPKQGSPKVEFQLNTEFLSKYVKQFTANFVGRGSGGYGSSYFPVGFRNVLIPTERISVLVTLPNIIEDLAKFRGLQNFFPVSSQAQQQQGKLSLIDFVANYLNAIQNLTASKKEISKNASDLIMGSLTLGLNLPPFYINFRAGENSIPLNLISSGTLQLIPLIVMAESNRNNILLIEEPEINLHANKQVEVAEYLWNLVEERDNSIFTSTHSDYLVMRLAHLSKGNKKKNLRVYLLNEGHTKPLKIDKNGEIEEIKTIGSVMNKLLLEA